MKRPIIALVGRPNVGKSALFNSICKKRVSIVDEQEAVTRDRLYVEVDFFGRKFTLVDTGGMDNKSKKNFNKEILEQSKIAIQEADGIIFVVDSRVGITLQDREVAKYLLKTKKPVLLAVNKIDDPSQETLIGEFYGLGLKEIMPVSAIQNFQIAEILEKILSFIPEEAEEEKVLKNVTMISIVGRPNVGKSTLLNHLCKEKRTVVSPIAGTTRDNIDVLLEKDEKKYLFIDTAGVKRKTKEKDVVEKFASIRTREAIDRSEICLLVIDAVDGITTQEKKIAELIHEKKKGLIVLFNKWDLVKGYRQEHCLKVIRKELFFLKDFPIYFISAKTGRNLEELFLHIDRVKQNYTMRISTAHLNKFIEKAMQLTHPPMILGKRLRIYYMTQVSVAPPKFVLFVNYPSLFVEAYKKYLINHFRKTFGFEGIPISFSIKARNKKN